MQRLDGCCPCTKELDYFWNSIRNLFALLFGIVTVASPVPFFFLLGFPMAKKTGLERNGWAVDDPKEIKINMTMACFVPNGGQEHCQDLGSAVSTSADDLGLSLLVVSGTIALVNMALLLMGWWLCYSAQWHMGELVCVYCVVYGFLLAMYASKLAIGAEFAVTVRKDIRRASFDGDRLEIACGEPPSTVCRWFNPFADEKSNCSAPCWVVDWGFEPESAAVECEGFEACEVRRTKAKKSCDSSETDCTVHITQEIWILFAIDVALVLGTFVIGSSLVIRTSSRLRRVAADVVY